MKYIVSGGANLSLSDGTKFELKPGVHDGSSIPDSVKNHWAFKAYAKPLDEPDQDKAKETKVSTQLTALKKENTTLKAKVGEHEKTIAEHEKTIADQAAVIADLKAKVAPEDGNTSDTPEGTENTGGEGETDAEKQQDAN